MPAHVHPETFFPEPFVELDLVCFEPTIFLFEFNEKNVFIISKEDSIRTTIEAGRLELETNELKSVAQLDRIILNVCF